MSGVSRSVFASPKDLKYNDTVKERNVEGFWASVSASDTCHDSINMLAIANLCKSYQIQRPKDRYHQPQHMTGCNLQLSSSLRRSRRVRGGQRLSRFISCRQSPVRKELHEDLCRTDLRSAAARRPRVAHFRNVVVLHHSQARISAESVVHDIATVDFGLDIRGTESIALSHGGHEMLDRWET
jgi:hypothetical protein